MAIKARDADLAWEAMSGHIEASTIYVQSQAPATIAAEETVGETRPVTEA